MSPKARTATGRESFCGALAGEGEGGRERGGLELVLAVGVSDLERPRGRVTNVAFLASLVPEEERAPERTLGPLPLASGETMRLSSLTSSSSPMSYDITLG